MNPFTLDIQGFAGIQERLRSAPDRLKKDVGGVLKKNADVIARNAKRDVVDNESTDTGRLANAISVDKDNDLQYSIVSPVSYSPYLEWGTKKRARVPTKLREYAAQFRGLKTGSAEEALHSIMQWVIRKGIKIDSAATYKSGKKKGQNKQLTAEQTGYIIFHYIMLVGTKPHPFFFKNFDAQEPVIIRDVEKVLDI